MPGHKKILLGHLGQNGDCLYATSVARQIKVDYPGSHLTWAIGSIYRSVADGNPYVDALWVVPMEHRGEMNEAWRRFESDALRRKLDGEFDEVFLIQIFPGNPHHYDGTVRSSIFRSYPNRITVPVTPVLRLPPSDVENVRRFAEAHRLADRAQVVLFETSPKSGQSFVTPEFAMEVAQRVVACNPDVCVILSSNLPFSSTDGRIVDGSVLSFRENAELTKYCTLLVGCSSGISWLCTTDWAKPLPMIQLIKGDSFCFASFVYDHERFGLATDGILEMSGCSAEDLCRCVNAVFEEGFEKARARFHERIAMRFDYFEDIEYRLLKQGQFRKAYRYLSINLERHGLHRQFFLWPFSRIRRKLAGAVRDFSCRPR